MTRGFPPTDPRLRWEPKVDRQGPVPADAPELGRCWLWTGSISTRGYGRLGVKGKALYAHRLAYEWFVGPLTPGLQIDHLCRNRACVNPDHLEQVTPQENMHRGRAPSILLRLTEECSKGHPMAGENLYVSPRGRRACRTCTRDRARRKAS